MANPDLLLINAGGTRKKTYQALAKSFSGLEPPTWIAMTAGFVRRKGFSVDVLDANALNLTHEEAAEEVRKRDPGLTGILVYGQQANTSTPTMIGASALAKEIKSGEPERPLAITGWHPSALPERTLREEACDFVGEGEGVFTYLGLLQGKPKTQIPGLWWRENGKLLHNTRASDIRDLTSELGDVAWDLLPMDKYRAFNWHCLGNLEERTSHAAFYTSLGCKFKCNFCCIHANFGGRGVRNWSPDWVLGQIDHLVETHGVKNINLNDELFVFNPAHFGPIAQGLIDREFGLNIAAFASVDCTRKEHLPLLKKAGFNWLKLGIESGNPDVLRSLNKGRYGLEKIREVVHAGHEEGIDFCANFMFGNPGDTMKTMQDTLDLACELNCAFPSFFATMAPPGSALYERALREGTRLPETWDGFGQQSYNFVPLPNGHLTSEQILDFRDRAFDHYFTRPEYLSMIGSRFGKEAREHVEDMCRIKLKRRILGD